MLVLSNVRQWFQNKLVDCMSPATLDPPKLQGPCGPSIVTGAYFSRVSHLFQNILKPLVHPFILTLA